MREAGKSKTCVWRWQERFAAEGVDGLLRDKTRPSRIPKLDPSVAERIVALTMEAPQRMGPVRQWPGGWRQRQFRAAHLARARAPAASGAAVQAVEGPGLRREAARYRRALRRSAGARGRAQRRREEPDPGA